MRRFPAVLEPPGPGLWRRWFNDTGSRIEDAKRFGYRHVYVDGRAIDRKVGTQANGEPLWAYMMEITRQERFLRGFFEKHKCKPRVRARIWRLNAEKTSEGGKIRGWHPAPTLHQIRYESGVMGKREFIVRFGRAEFLVIPKECLRRYGKRCYVSLDYVFVWTEFR